MDTNAIIHTIERIAFVAAIGYLIPISLGLYIDSLLALPKIPFFHNFALESSLFIFGLLLILLGCRDLIKYGNGSPNPKFPTKI